MQFGSQDMKGMQPRLDSMRLSEQIKPLITTTQNQRASCGANDCRVRSIARIPFSAHRSERFLF